MAKWDKQREILEKRRDELEARLNEIERTLEEPAPKDDEDRATEREDDEVLQGIERQGIREVQAINAALDRIQNGTYGICQKCGDEISQERLDLLPFTPYCRRCAA